MPVYCILPNCYVWPWLINLTESRSGNQEIVETRTQNRKTSTCTEQLLLLRDHFPELEERKETKRAAAAYNELVGVGGGGTDAVGAGELGLAVEAPLPGAAVRARGAGVAHLNSAEIGEAQDEIPRMDSHESRKRRGFFFRSVLGARRRSAYIGSCRSQSQGQEAEQEEGRRRCKGAAHLGDLLVRST